MRTKNITLLICLFGLLLVNAQFGNFPLGQYPETLVVDSWNGAAWEEQVTNTATYNSDCYVETTTTTNLGQNLTRKLFNYNSSNQPIEIITQSWNGSAWDNTGRQEIAYLNGLIAEEIESFWTGANWFLNNRTIYSHHSSGILVEYLYQERDIITSSWTNLNRIQYNLNAGNLVIEELTQIWDNSASQWVDNRRILFSYNTTDEPIEELEQTYNPSGLVWDNFARTTFSYPTASSSENLYDLWDGSVWMPESKNINLFSSNDELLQSEELEWDGSSYVPMFRTSFTYDSNGFLIENLSEEYNVGNWENLSRTILTYPSCVTLSSEYFENLNVSFYPNPSDNGFRVSIKPEVAENLSYSIYDVAGRLVKMNNLKNNDFISTNNLKNGLYIINLTGLGLNHKERIIVNH